MNQFERAVELMVEPFVSSVTCGVPEIMGHERGVIAHGLRQALKEAVVCLLDSDEMTGEQLERYAHLTAEDAFAAHLDDLLAQAEEGK